MKDKISILDWFKPCNLDHIEAYEHLREFGYWPDNFIPENVIFPRGWLSDLKAIMADLWCEHLRML